MLTPVGQKISGFIHSRRQKAPVRAAELHNRPTKQQLLGDSLHVGTSQPSSLLHQEPTSIPDPAKDQQDMNPKEDHTRKLPFELKKKIGLMVIGRDPQGNISDEQLRTHATLMLNSSWRAAANDMPEIVANRLYRQGEPRTYQSCYYNDGADTYYRTDKTLAAFELKKLAPLADLLTPTQQHVLIDSMTAEHVQGHVSENMSKTYRQPSLRKHVIELIPFISKFTPENQRALIQNGLKQTQGQHVYYEGVDGADSYIEYSDQPYVEKISTALKKLSPLPNKETISNESAPV